MKNERKRSLAFPCHTPALFFLMLFLSAVSQLTEYLERLLWEASTGSTEPALLDPL